MSSSAEDIASEIVWPKDIGDVPKEVFVRKDLFEQELKTIFYGPHWHPVAHESEIPNNGDFKTFNVGRVPLLIARGEDGVVRSFINACTHRGNQVETEPCGNRKYFVCPYHRWTFNNDGAIRGCPGMEDFSPKFSKEEYGLKELRCGSVFGLIFVTLSDETEPLEEWMGPVRNTLEKQIGNEAGLKLLGYHKVTYTSNWKAYTDNDGYHAPLLHTGFRLLGWMGGGGKQYATLNGHAGVESQLKPGKSTNTLKDPSLIDFKDAQWDAGSFISAFFPFTIITKHMDIINIRFAIAREYNKTEVHYAYFAKADDDEEMIRHRIRQASNLIGPCGMISMEDAAIFQRVQIGSESPGIVSFQKGLKDLETMQFEFAQNDETANLPRWDYYRRCMGFRREGEA